MPFGLRNAGATYKKCMHDQISKNVQVYVEFRMKLNPAKCTFGVVISQIFKIKMKPACIHSYISFFETNSP
jgi:hypothetical protein